MSVLISVYIQPNSSKEEIIGEHNNMLKIKIKAPADNGKANQALVKFLAKYLNIRIRQVTIIKGLISREKTILLDIDKVPSCLEKFLTSFE